MLDAGELEELRHLQARAYGRDAALTDAEAVRLRDLEERRVARIPESAEPASLPPEKASAARGDGAGAGRQTPADIGASEGRVREDGPLDPPPVPEQEESPAVASPSLVALARGHWRSLAIAAAVVLVIGLGVGWLAFGKPAIAPVELTAEQQKWQDDLISAGVYDQGSIRALAVEEGAVIWSATRDERERTCLILGTGEMTQPSCDRTERIGDTGIYGAITVRGTDDRQRQVSVQMLLTASGEPAVAVTSYDAESGVSGITYANDEETRTAERLAEDGFEANSLWVVGYDGDVPVWTGMKRDSQNQCLIYDGSAADSPSVCADPETMQEQASSLVLTVVDSETGETTSLELASNHGPSALVITRGGGVVGAGED